MPQILSPTKLLDFIYSLMPTQEMNLTVEVASDRTEILERVIRAIKMGYVDDESEDSIPVAPAPAGDGVDTGPGDLLPENLPATDEEKGV